MKAKLYLFLFMLWISMCPAAAQTFSAAGTVTDEKAEPIIGATVIVKSTSHGAITDIDGKFRIDNLNATDILVISYLGMKKQELPAQPQMNVTLEADSEVFDDVIVTAFGTAKKSAFTGSATMISSETIEKRQVSNVMQSLSGEVAGLQIAPQTAPGSTQSILIRGEGSINAGTEPLIVLDGMPYEGGWNNINPQDVESITVLKDAASNALYGARGANGVIIINTKKGQAGRSVVTLEARYGCNTRALPDYDRIDNPGEYYEQYYKALYTSYVNKGASAASAHRQANENLFGSSSDGGLGYNVYTVPDGEYLIGTNGRINPNATLGRRIYRNGSVYTLYPDDWTDAAYRTGTRQEYNVSISGGNAATQIYGSFGYLRDEGIVRSTDYERYSGRLRASHQAKPWLMFGGNFSFVHSDSHSIYDDGTYTTNSVFTQVANIAPIYPLYVRDGDGNLLYDANGVVYDWGNGTYNEGGEIRPFCTNVNNINSLDTDYWGTRSNSVNADGFADVNLLKSLKFTFKAGTSLWESRDTQTYNPFYGYSAQADGSTTVSHSRVSTVNLQQLLTWNLASDTHNVNVMAGHESYKYNYEDLSASKTGAVDYWGNHELNGYLTSYGIPTSSASDYNTEGWLFRAMYDYAGRYFAQLSYRRDASSRFDPDERWGDFWSVGGAWILSRESWFDAPWVGNLKLKASYGEQGNDNIGDFRYTNTYEINNIDGELSLDFKTKGNRDISWEKCGNFNAGIEFELLGGRLSGSAEYYNRTTRDMLMWFSTPATLGYSGYYQNVGDMRNQGVEVNLNATPVKTRIVEWNISMNLTSNHQEVTHLDEANRSISVDGYDGFQQGNNHFVGEGLPLGSFYVVKYAGTSDEGRSQWYRTLSDGSQTVTTDYSQATFHIVKAKKPVFGGFGTTVSALGIDLSAQFTYQIGGKGYDSQYAMLMTCPTAGVTGNALHRDILDAWTEERPTDTPRFCFGDEYSSVISDRFLIKKSYLSLQNVQLGYTLPARLTGVAGISKVRIYATADNVCFWSKRKGYDPRTTEGYGVYSPMRAVSGGISIQF